MSTPLPPRSLGAGERWGRDIENSRDEADRQLDLQSRQARNLQQRNVSLAAQLATLTMSNRRLMAQLQKAMEQIAELRQATRQNTWDIRDIRKETVINND